MEASGINATTNLTIKKRESGVFNFTLGSSSTPTAGGATPRAGAGLSLMTPVAMLRVGSSVSEVGSNAGGAGVRSGLKLVLKKEVSSSSRSVKKKKRESDDEDS